MQGFRRDIPTEQKIKYLQLLIDTGFSMLDAGSIVSPKFVPQLADTVEVINALDTSITKTKLMVLVASLKGAETIAENEKISLMSFPFSVSPTFQKKNINKTIEESRELIRQIHEICQKNKKELIVYIPMAFGNPYGDPWDNEILLNHIDFLKETGICAVYLSNVSLPVTEEIIGAVYRAAIPFFPNLEFGLHLHTLQTNWRSQVESAWNAGCRNFDGVLSGLGGCPMSDKMLGNIDTDLLISFLQTKGIDTGLDKELLSEARSMAAKLFSN